MKTLKVEAFTSDEAYYRWLDARKAGLRVSKYTPIIVPEDDCTTAHIIVKCKRLDTAIKHAKEAFADYSDVVEALEELERKRAEDKHVTGISDRYNTISTCYNGIDGEYSFYIVVEARDEVAEASEESNPEETETETQTETESESEKTEEIKEDAKMSNTSKKTLDRTAAIKTIFYHLACGGYGGLPRATELYKYLSCDGEIGLTREEIKRYMLENALCDEDSFDYSDEEIADEWFRFADEDEEETEEETETTSETNEENEEDKKMKTYEIKRYDSLSDYGKDNLDQCTPVVITEEHMTTYLLRVHCDEFIAALTHFCEVFADENVDWEPVVDCIIEHDRHSNFWIQFTGDFSYVFCWKEHCLCEVTITFYRWNIPTDETEDETTAKAMVVEPCPHCESEIEMQWDVKTQGYKAFCPVCGEQLMLCDECQHRGEDGEDLDDCDFDGRDGSCRFNPKGNVGNSQDSSRVYCPVLGGWIMRYDACRGGCEYDSETDTCKLYRNNTRKGGGA